MVFTDWQYKAELLVTFKNTAGGPSVAQLGQHQVGFFFLSDVLYSCTCTTVVGQAVLSRAQKEGKAQASEEVAGA